jgi:hypothetical protein
MWQLIAGAVIALVGVLIGAAIESGKKEKK